MWQGPERRKSERRHGERRQQARGTDDRRRGDRRAASSTAAFVMVAAGWMAVPDANAQVYTRRNERGVIEAWRQTAEAVQAEVDAARAAG